MSKLMNLLSCFESGFCNQSECLKDLLVGGFLAPAEAICSDVPSATLLFALVVARVFDSVRKPTVVELSFYTKGATAPVHA